MSQTSFTLALVTPARNEADTIGDVIDSVVRQRVRPARWVIVSDGSTDDTDALIAKAAAEHDWIRLVRVPEHANRDFGAKVRAFTAGARELADVEYDIIGCSDADITFPDEDYFAFLLDRFSADEELGVAGTPFVESGRHYDYSFTSIEHVSGACQLFRRACFEAVGGYQPLPGGGIDWLAVTSARMHGWKTRTFPERVCIHHRPMGTALVGPLAASFRTGRKDYALGWHPLWQVCRSLYQMTSRPWVIGGAMIMIGYLWGAISRTPRSVPREVVEFNRAEQMERLGRFFSRKREGTA